jgi:hypothetical protein
VALATGVLILTDGLALAINAPALMVGPVLMDDLVPATNGRTSAARVATRCPAPMAAPTSVGQDVTAIEGQTPGPTSAIDLIFRIGLV